MSGKYNFVLISWLLLIRYNTLKINLGREFTRTYFLWKVERSTWRRESERFWSLWHFASW